MRAELVERGLLGHVRPIHAFAAEDEAEWISDLMRAFGGQPKGDWATLNFAPQRIEVVVQMTVTEAHFRAVAKIAFHYALSAFPDLTGAEPGVRPDKGLTKSRWGGSR